MNIGIISFSSSSQTEMMQAASNLHIIDLDITINDISYAHKSKKEVLQAVNKTKQIPKTSQPSSQLIVEGYEKMLHQYQDVLVLTPAKELSGTHQNCLLSKELLSNDSLKERIHIVETRSFALSEAIICDYALSLLNQQMPLNDIIKLLEQKARKITTYIVNPSLDFLKLSGRVNSRQIVVGKMISLKLILRHHGETVEIYKKTRGTKSMLKEIEKTISAGNIEQIYYGTLGVQPEIYSQFLTMISQQKVPAVDTGHASLIMLAHFGDGGFGYAIEEK